MAEQNRSLLRMDESAEEAERRAQAMARVGTDAPLPSAIAGLSDPCEEAAALYAVGRHKDAANILTAELSNKKGLCPAPLWYMLLDIYQSTAQHAAFEKLAMFFAKVFDTSPPSWEEAPQVAGGFGRNVMIIEGNARDVGSEKVRDFIQAAKALRQARLDLSRARLDGSPEDPMASVRRLLEILPKIRQQNVPVFLMGETQMMSDIRARIRGAEGDVDELWLLLFELMQWRGMEENFEDLAVEYAQRFDRCAPGYEMEGAVALAPEKAAPNEDAKWSASGNTLTPPPVISDSEASALTEKIEHMLAQHGSIRIDASAVRLVEYEAATEFSRFLGMAGHPPDRVVVKYPNELVRVLLKIVGAEPYVAVLPRKR